MIFDLQHLGQQHQGKANLAYQPVRSLDSELLIYLASNTCEKWDWFIHHNALMSVAGTFNGGESPD